MKINYFLTSVFVMSVIMISCGEQKENTEESASNHVSTEVENDTVSEIAIETIEGDMDMTIQQQWQQIKGFVELGDKQSLGAYVDKNADTFSAEEWGYIDFLYPEYFATFSTYGEFSELPLADYFAPNTRVVSVYFETEAEGMTFESAVMIYFQERAGKIYIVGCELAG
jgi:hypothetical protein